MAGKNSDNNPKKNIKKDEPKKKHISGEVLIITGALIGVVLELCNFNLLGTVGGWLKYAQFGLFGCMAYIFPVFVFLAFFIKGWRRMGGVSQVVFSAVFFVFLSVIAQLITADSYTEFIFSYFKTSAESLTGGGFIGGAIAAGLYVSVGYAGAYIVSVLVMLFCIFMVIRQPVTDAVEKSRMERVEPQPKQKQKEPDWQPAPLNEKTKKTTKKTQKKKDKDDVSEDEVVIKIVHSPAKKQADRAQLKRAQNKAQSLRSGGNASAINAKKTRGVAENTALHEEHAGGDQLHEITRTEAEKQQAAESSKKKKEDTSVLTVTNYVYETAENAVSEEKPEKKASKRPREVKTEKNENAAAAQEIREPARQMHSAAPAVLPSASGEIPLPPMELLSRQKGKRLSGEDNQALAQRLEMILDTFGVHAKVTDMMVGPSVTRYELQLELGTKVSKITSLTDDLKLNLAVPEVRIAPIPNKAAIGIEVPNKDRQVVHMRELFLSSELVNHPSKIAFAAGKDISGNVVVADLAKMPHMLVAGTTGSGKSVFLNSILMCILYRARPSEVGLIIIDPKKVEFGIYSGIPHLIREVVTDPQQAVSTLRWAVGEMTNRYQRMQLSGVRDFTSYNEKFDRGRISEEEENPTRMPQIVIIIDELADLMMVAAKEVESLICRLAQLARAAGIHLLIATQRPSVDVVTGLIKANIPARAALLVASGVDSRTIIDMVGAEKLMGNGDMLFYPTGYTQPKRVQGAFVSDKEIRDTVKFLKEHKNEDYFAREASEMEHYMDSAPENEDANAAADDGGRFDEHFREAGLLCIDMGKASSSMLQRRFNIGFNRAARIIDQLESVGAVGPQNGAKPREMLVDSITFNEICDANGIN